MGLFLKPVILPSVVILLTHLVLQNFLCRDPTLRQSTLKRLQNLLFIFPFGSSFQNFKSQLPQGYPIWKHTYCLSPPPHHHSAFLISCYLNDKPANLRSTDAVQESKRKSPFSLWWSSFRRQVLVDPNPRPQDSDKPSRTER